MEQNEGQREKRIEQIRAVTKIYKGWPKQKVDFCDIFPILQNPPILNTLLDIFEEELKSIDYNKIFMLQSRGFLFGVPLSLRTGKPCYPLRKIGKLPGECINKKYNLQYGNDGVQIKKEYVEADDRVVIIDDVLATGGTLSAAIWLLQEQGAKIAKILLINQVKALQGIKNLKISPEKVYVMFDI